jgi:regulator of replication initiation timing
MHRKATPELRSKVFGDVHMLSHLVGAANRADIRRLVALERENTELRERLDRQQLRSHELTEERDSAVSKLQHQLIHHAASPKGPSFLPDEPEMAARIRQEESERAASLIAVQTGRRERAEQAAVAAVAEASRLQEELDHLREHAIALGRELAAAEAQLKLNAGEAAPSAYLDSQLQGRRILYVGGRPSSMPAIRDLVHRHGGEFQRHGGRLEDRSGLLASAVSWAEVVVFPVDCSDHESVDSLKRLCVRQQVRYVPLRSAGIGCFAAAFSSPPAESPEGPGLSSGGSICRRNG